MEQIKRSEKMIAKHLLENIKKDVLSVTGSNLRNIMNLTNHDNIDDICMNDIENLKFNAIPEGCEWRIQMLEELLSVRNSEGFVEGFTHKDINDMIAKQQLQIFFYLLEAVHL